MSRVVVLVDGDHHPDTIRVVLERLRAAGEEAAAAVFCGGGEKIDRQRLDEAYGVPTYAGEPVSGLRRAIDDHRPDAVIDLSDEPVMTSTLRARLATVALGAGLVFRGADHDMAPPTRERVLRAPSIGVIATRKRSGKTAVAASIGGRAAALGRRPLIIAIGRGGPHPPSVIEANASLDPRTLVAMADDGLHAASDYVEDALTARIATIGCFRVGGGEAGGTADSNAPDAARLANERDEDLVIVEGSGATIPTVETNRTLACVPADTSPSDLRDTLLPLRVLLADVVVVTMAEAGAAAVDDIEAAIREIVPTTDVVRAAFRPEPLEDVTGRRVVFCCTAPDPAGRRLASSLEATHGCDVVGVTSALSDRERLIGDLDSMPPHDLVLTELKGAAVDIVMRRSLERGTPVVVARNVPEGDAYDAAIDRLITEA